METRGPGRASPHFDPNSLSQIVAQTTFQAEEPSASSPQAKKRAGCVLANS